MKKLFLTGLVFGIVLFASIAFADGWGNYFVRASGPYESSAFPSVGKVILIKLVPVEGGDATYFRLGADRENEFLAIALTAQSLDAPVRVFIQKLYSNSHWSDYVVTSMFIGNTIGDLN